ncbi:MAG: PAS domain-containing protein [Chloroflexi bacterium]|nr:PAS domain-containing protein [Chloroflexota bacterium]
MKSRYQGIEFPLLRRRSPGFPEFESLLDFISQAGMLVDVKNHNIHLANTKATELTAFTRVELTKLGLESLFPDFSDSNSNGLLNIPRGSWELTLVDRNGAEISTLVTFSSLGTDGQWGLVIIEPASQVQQKELERERQIHLWDTLLNLSAAPQKQSFAESIAHIIKTGQRLTGVDMIAIYTPDDEADQIIRVAQTGFEDIIPHTLQHTEIDKLRKPILWTHGKRTLSSLHRKALVENLAFLASVPYELPEQQFGLVVAANQVSAPSSDLLPLLHILAATISNCIENQKIASSIQEKLRQQKGGERPDNLIMDSIRDGIIYVGIDNKVLDINASAKQALGYTFEEVKGLPIDDLLFGSESLIPTLEFAKQGYPTQKLTDIKLHSRNGTTLPANIRTAPIIINDKLEKIAIIISDLSDYEEFRIRAQHLEQQAVLGEIMAIFAHEVRNPINNISTGLQLMALDLTFNDPSLDQIVRLQKDCDRLTDLMRSVLSFSGSREYRMESLDLVVLSKKVLHQWQSRMQKINVKSRLHTSPYNPEIFGDQRAIEQVFTNLISNALHAMGDRGGTLSIRINYPTEEVNTIELLISDTGPGIQDDIVDHVFEPFFTTHEQGTGLGLSITKGIITAHKGQINVTSFTGGTVFQIILPISEKI